MSQYTHITTYDELGQMHNVSAFRNLISFQRVMLTQFLILKLENHITKGSQHKTHFSEIYLPGKERKKKPCQNPSMSLRIITQYTLKLRRGNASPCHQVALFSV